MTIEFATMETLHQDANRIETRIFLSGACETDPLESRTVTDSTGESFTISTGRFSFEFYGVRYVALFVRAVSILPANHTKS